MKLALCVGIDSYTGAPLRGCVNDANSIGLLLSRNEDDTPNFSTKVITCDSGGVTKALLKHSIAELFSKRSEIALFYFAGHGKTSDTGGALLTQDDLADGYSFQDLLAIASKSAAREKVIILDCCFSGSLGIVPLLGNVNAVLPENTAILAACRPNEGASEDNGRGAFTTLVCAALEGGAADVCGKVSLAGIYAYADEVFGGWEQRPMFKANLAQLTPLRQCHAFVPHSILRKLTEYFQTESAEFKLDPSFEPQAEPRDGEHEAQFAELQKLRSARLIEPVGADHMYFAAMESKSCRLTHLGRFYWRRVKSQKI